MKKYIVILLFIVLLWPFGVGAIVRFPNPGSERVGESRVSRRGWEKSFEARRAQRVETIRRAQPFLNPVQLSVPSEPVTLPGNDWDVSVPTFLLLGSRSPIVGSARVFPDAEPLNVSEIRVVLVSPVTSVESFLVYDGKSKFLGNAYLDSSIAGGSTYMLPIKISTLIIPHREVFQWYVKARLRSHVAGGTSGESLQIKNFTVKGDGLWSNRSYTKSTTETFTVFQTARSVIKKISRVSPETGVLASGLGQLLGTFEFAGMIGDAGAEIRITDITFQVNQAGGVNVSNVKIKRLGSGTSIDCSVAGGVVTCASIGAGDGSIRSGPATFQIYGDVSVPSGLTRASLQLLLNEPGSSSRAGAIVWTDGISTFNWVQFEQPIAPGTVFSY